jgi:RNA polymerase sigma-70 factor (ECF subfamily)
MNVNIDTQEFRLNVKKMISKKVITIEDQEDITQDVLFKVVKYARTEDPGSFFSWLKMTVNSSIGDFYRKKGSSKVTPLTSDEWEQIIIDEELVLDLTCCIDPFLKKMDESEATLIREIDLKGKSQQEMAATLNMNYSTLKSRLQKSRKTLLENISACCPPGSDACSVKGKACE